MTKGIFVPAAGTQLMHHWNNSHIYKGQDFKFWSDSSVFKYPYLLTSAFFGMEERFESVNYREQIKYPKDLLHIGDSGGFQMVTQDFNPDPTRVLRWLESNCDIGMNLDIPITAKGHGTIPPMNIFKEALDKSVKNFDVFQQCRDDDSKLKLYNILHGQTIEYMDVWYDGVKDFSFEGWAIGIKPPSPFMMGLAFLYLYEKGVLDNTHGLHFFGTSGYKVIPLICYISKKILKNKLVTFDSASYNIGSMFRKYYLPLKISGSNSIFFGDRYVENENIKDLPCMCPACELFSVDDYNRIDYGGPLISLHNLYQYISITKICNGLVNNLDKLDTMLKVFGSNNNDALQSILFVEYGIEHGVKKAYDRFREFFTIRGKEVKEKSLLHYNKGSRMSNVSHSEPRDNTKGVA